MLAAGLAPRATTAPAIRPARQVAEGPATGVDRVDDDGRQRFAGGGLERRLPSRVDIDELEQRAGDAVDRGEVLDAGPGAGHVESLAQCVGASDPCGAVGVGASARLLGGHELAARGRVHGLGSGHLVGQRGLGGLGGGGLAAQPVGVDVEAVEPDREGLLAVAHPGQLGRRPLDTGAESGELASGLRRAGTELGPVRRHRRRGGAPVGGQPGPLVGESVLLDRQALELRRQRPGGHVGLGQLTGQPGRLGFERGDDGGVDDSTALALDRAPPLGQDGGEATRPLDDALRAHEPVGERAETDGARTEGRQLGLGGEDGGVERGEVRLEGNLVGGELSPRPRPRLEPAAEGGELAAGEVAAQQLELGHQITVAAGGVGLALEGSQLAPDLAHEVLQAQQARLGGGQLALGPLLALPELEHAGGFLDHEAALFGAGVEDGVDLALADDHVLLAADAGVGQQVLDVEEATGRPVEGVLGVAAAEQRPRDRDLVELDRQQPGGVVDRQAHLGAAERRALRGAGEDHVVHLLAADRRGRLGAQHPADGVDDVGLARPVRADDDGDARLEVEDGDVGEGLEPLQGQRLEEHPTVEGTRPDSPSRAPPLRPNRRFGLETQTWQEGQKNVERFWNFSRAIVARQRRQASPARS